ncbi:MAG TPA: VWA domain-containing protein [Acidimicrobiales bacterium]|nr:VWA domain-containing protein [Acidimicrobiales bacterium]
MPAESRRSEQLRPEQLRPEQLRAERVAVAFGRVLRRSGLDASVSAVLAFAEALSLVGLWRPGAVYWAGQASFVRRQEDIAPYTRAFVAFFGSGGLASSRPLPPAPVTLALDDASEAPGSEDGEEADETTLAVRYSSAEVLSARDFATLDRDELAEVQRLMSVLRLRPPSRRSRRPRPTRRRAGELDLRRTVRRALRSGGEQLRLERREPGERPRRIVLLVDVSGSMEPYARALLNFAHAALTARRHVEVFTLGTRLTRVTRELSWRDPDAALERAAATVVDLAGGTRLGEGFRAFNDRFGVAGLARGAIVVILSDGWDRGDPQVLAEEMARLERVAYKVIWVNPLKATPGYAPLARGMAAALPYVDELVEGHSLASLEALSEVMSR